MLRTTVGRQQTEFVFIGESFSWKEMFFVSGSAPGFPYSGRVCTGDSPRGMFCVLWLGWWFYGRLLLIFLLLREFLRSVGSLHSRLAFRYLRRHMKTAIVNGDDGLDRFV